MQYLGALACRIVLIFFAAGFSSRVLAEGSCTPCAGSLSECGKTKEGNTVCCAYRVACKKDAQGFGYCDQKCPSGTQCGPNANGQTQCCSEGYKCNPTPDFHCGDEPPAVCPTYYYACGSGKTRECCDITQACINNKCLSQCPKGRVVCPTGSGTTGGGGVCCPIGEQCTFDSAALKYECKIPPKKDCPPPEFACPQPIGSPFPQCCNPGQTCSTLTAGKGGNCCPPGTHSDPEGFCRYDGPKCGNGKCPDGAPCCGPEGKQSCQPVGTTCCGDTICSAGTKCSNNICK